VNPPVRWAPVVLEQYDEDDDDRELHNYEAQTRCRLWPECQIHLGAAPPNPRWHGGPNWSWTWADLVYIHGRREAGVSFAWIAVELGKTHTAGAVKNAYYRWLIDLRKEI
jgi:hypothetical protein